jgi:hypothetical protein
VNQDGAGSLTTWPSRRQTVNNILLLLFGLDVHRRAGCLGGVGQRLIERLAGRAARCATGSYARRHVRTDTGAVVAGLDQVDRAAYMDASRTGLMGFELWHKLVWAGISA